MKRKSRGVLALFFLVAGTVGLDWFLVYAIEPLAPGVFILLATPYVMVFVMILMVGIAERRSDPT